MGKYTKKSPKFFKNIREINGFKERRCTQCKEWFPETTEYFYMRNKSKPEKGFNPECKKCSSKRSRKWAINHWDIMKECFKRNHKNPERKAKEKERKKIAKEAGYFTEYRRKNKDKMNEYSSDELNWKSHNFERGDVYLFNFGDNGEGSEIRNLRPAVVLSNNISNRHSSILQVAPLTSQSRSNLPVHVKLDKTDNLRFQSLAQIEQTRCVSKSRGLIDGKFIKITKLSEKRMKEIDSAIKIQFGLC